MELREFIQATLQQIVEGVSAAQKDTGTVTDDLIFNLEAIIGVDLLGVLR